MKSASGFFLACLLTGFGGSAAASQPCSAPNRLTQNSPRVAILGSATQINPWTIKSLRELKRLGFNQIQLNVAWGTRTGDEALNLADVITLPGETPVSGALQRLAEIKRRIALAKTVGLRTVFHFGSPYRYWDYRTGKAMWRFRDVRYTPRGLHWNQEGNPARGQDTQTKDPTFDITNPAIADHEVALLKRFRDTFPEVDDILVYTFDQDAWQTAEFHRTNHTYGVPLAERLAPYLQRLRDTWAEGRQGHTMWWEPWELSAGQVYKIVPQLPRRNFGLMLHSNIAEVQLAIPTDVWYENTARLARRHGIPVVGEGFFSSVNEEIEPMNMPFPELVDQQIGRLSSVCGVVGIKEYYGTNIDRPDLSREIFGLRARFPNESTEQLMSRLTSQFGHSGPEVKKFLGHMADAYRYYPWDSTWWARHAGAGSVDHGWKSAIVRGVTFDSPSWKSTREALFMKTDTLEPHFWMREDMQLRLEKAVEEIEQAERLAPKFLDNLDKRHKVSFTQILKDLNFWKRLSRSYALHYRESNVAFLLRQDLESGLPLSPHLVSEMSRLLTMDAENQGNEGRVMLMKSSFEKDPVAFLRTYLLPGDPSEDGRDLILLSTR